MTKLTSVLNALDGLETTNLEALDRLDTPEDTTDLDTLDTTDWDMLDGLDTALETTDLDTLGSTDLNTVEGLDTTDTTNLDTQHNLFTLSF